MKLAGLVDSGGDVRNTMGAGEIAVNGTREDRRGRQLHHGDVVDFVGTKIRVPRWPTRSGRISSRQADARSPGVRSTCLDHRHAGQ
jgi:ribosome-associated protein YbcJ (S4-like RNA binding protein)